MHRIALGALGALLIASCAASPSSSTTASAPAHAQGEAANSEGADEGSRDEAVHRADEPSANNAANAPRSTWRDDQQDREIRLLRDEVFRLQEEIERLKSQGAQAAARPTRPARKRPDPAAVYSVPVAGSPWKGNADALVTIVRGYEYACPFCERSRATMEQILKDYQGEVRIVYKNFIVHPSTAQEPANAACAAHLQGLFPEMDKILWEESFKKRNFERKHIESLAQRVGLNMRQFEQDRDLTCPGIVKRDQEELAKVGLTGTPGFYINGRFLSGARPIGQFKPLIDQELAKAKAALRNNRSLTRANYYDREILSKGLTSLTP